MAALRELLESHGHTMVSSYISSGNVILTSDRSAAAIKRELEAVLLDPRVPDERCKAVPLTVRRG